MEAFDLIFAGTVLPGVDAEAAAARFARLTGIEAGQTLAAITAKRPRLAMQGLTAAHAHAWLARVSTIGIEASLRPSTVSAVHSWPPPEEPSAAPQPGVTETARAGLAPASGASELVECPLCGKLNLPVETFRCRQCGKERLCLRHQDTKSYLCEDCAADVAEKHRQAAPEPPAQAETPTPPTKAAPPAPSAPSKATAPAPPNAGNMDVGAEAEREEGAEENFFRTAWMPILGGLGYLLNHYSFRVLGFQIQYVVFLLCIFLMIWGAMRARNSAAFRWICVALGGLCAFWAFWEFWDVEGIKLLFFDLGYDVSLSPLERSFIILPLLSGVLGVLLFVYALWGWHRLSAKPQTPLVMLTVAWLLRAIPIAVVLIADLLG